MVEHADGGGSPPPVVVAPEPPAAGGGAGKPAAPPALPKTRFEQFVALVGLTAPILQVLGVVSGATAAPQRNDPIAFGVMIVLAVASAASVAYVFLLRPKAKDRRLISVLALAFGLAALTMLLVMVARTGAVNSRPVIEATVSGTGPVVIDGVVSGAGLGADGRIAVEVRDGEKVIYQAIEGSAPNSGAGTIAFKVQVPRVPDRFITIIAWIADDVRDGARCEDAMASDDRIVEIDDLPLISCMQILVSPPQRGGPRLDVTADTTTGNRAVMVAAGAVIDPGESLYVAVWDGTRVLHSSIVRPAADGAVNYSMKVPVTDKAVNICAVAHVLADGSTEPPRPSGSCFLSGSRAAYQRLFFPPAPPSAKPSASAAPSPSASTQPSASPMGGG
jgi:hypothetical protein